ncbi:MAG: amidohydrolase [Bacteroidales bacterium]|nr:amidohydrolase [Bacteroidales bacterium]
MERLLIKNIYCNGSIKDILIEDNLISRIGENIEVADISGRGSLYVIDGNKKAAIPGLINMHTHSAMTLMRGLNEDAPLNEWLSYIWKVEPRLDEELIYWGTKLACLEMLKTGTTCFNDQYWMIDTAVKAISEMGLRSLNPYVILDLHDKEKAENLKRECERIYRESSRWSSLNRFAIAIHAPYSVSKESMKWASDFAREHNLPVHMHLSETQQENADSMQLHGLTPTRYCEKLGILGPEMIAAHCVWIDDEDIKILADNDVKIVHNINSNLKLASGFNFKYKKFKEAGLTVCLGTDGCASSNNLDLLEAMKTTALLQKGVNYDPAAMPLDELMDCATVNGAKALGINTGKIEVGALADLSIIDIDNYAFTPNINFLANLIYSANSSCVETVICNGKIVMEKRKVEGEREILDNVNRLYKKLYV